MGYSRCHENNAILLRLFLVLLVLTCLVSSPPAGMSHNSSQEPQVLGRTTTVGVYNITQSTFYLRNTNSAGAADLTFPFGPSSTGFICGAPPPYYCTTGWFPLAGDWDGNGTVTIGLYHQPTGTFFLKNTNAAGPADLVFPYGVAGAGWLPVTGDWNGDGIHTIGLFDPGIGHFYLKNTNAAGTADLVFPYGPVGLGWRPIVGDWNGDGVDTVGLFAPLNGWFLLKNMNAAGPADLVFKFGPGDREDWFGLAGDWNGDGTDTVGLWNPGSSTFYLKNSNTAGEAEAADIVFPYGPSPATPFFIPVVGDWDGL